MSTSRFTLDRILANIRAPQESKQELVVEVSFPLPSSPDTMQAFIDTHGKKPDDAKTEKEYKAGSNIVSSSPSTQTDETFWNGVKGLVEELQAWITKNFSNDPSLRDQLNDQLGQFLNQHFQYKKEETKSLVKLYTLYNHGIPLLAKIIHIIKLEQDNNIKILHIDARKKIIRNMILGSSGLALCAPGAYTNINEASLNLLADLPLTLMGARREIAAQVAKAIINKHELWDQNFEDDEIHYINSILNEFANELGLLKVPDAYQRTREEKVSSDTGRILEAAWRSFPAEIMKNLTTETFLQNCFARANLTELIDEYQKKFEIYWANEIESSLEIYGEDPLFNIQNLSIASADFTSFTPKSIPEAELYFMITLLKRLESKGFINLQGMKTITDGEATVSIYPQRSLTLAYVEKNQTREPLISHIIDHLRADELESDDEKEMTDEREAVAIPILSKITDSRQRAEVIQLLLNTLKSDSNAPLLRELLNKVLWTPVEDEIPYFMDAVTHLQSYEFHHLLANLSPDTLALLVTTTIAAPELLWRNLSLDLSAHTSSRDLAKLIDPLMRSIGRNVENYLAVIKSSERNNNSVMHVVAKLFTDDESGMAYEDQLIALINNRAHVNLENKWGLTPLHVAAMNKNWRCAESLLTEISNISRNTNLAIKNLDQLIISFAEAGRWDLAYKAFTVNKSFQADNIRPYFSRLFTEGSTNSERASALALSLFLKYNMGKSSAGLINAVIECPDLLFNNIFAAPRGLAGADSPNLYNLFNVHRNALAVQLAVDKLEGATLVDALFIPNHSRYANGLRAMHVALSQLEAPLVATILDKALVANKKAVNTAFFDNQLIKQYIVCALENKDINVLKTVAAKIDHVNLAQAILQNSRAVIDTLSNKPNPGEWFAEIFRILACDTNYVARMWNAFTYPDSRYLSEQSLFTIAASIVQALRNDPAKLGELISNEMPHRMDIQTLLDQTQQFDINAIKAVINAYLSTANANPNMVGEQRIRFVAGILAELTNTNSALKQKNLLYTLLTSEPPLPIPQLAESMGYKSLQEATTHLDAELIIARLFEDTQAERVKMK